MAQNKRIKMAQFLSIILDVFIILLRSQSKVDKNASTKSINALKRLSSEKTKKDIIKAVIKHGLSQMN